MICLTKLIIFQHRKKTKKTSVLEMNIKEPLQHSVCLHGILPAQLPTCTALHLHNSIPAQHYACTAPPPSQTPLPAQLPTCTAPHVFSVQFPHTELVTKSMAVWMQAQTNSAPNNFMNRVIGNACAQHGWFREVSYSNFTYALHSEIISDYNFVSGCALSTQTPHRIHDYTICKCI